MQIINVNETLLNSILVKDEKFKPQDKKKRRYIIQILILLYMYAIIVLGSMMRVHAYIF